MAGVDKPLSPGKGKSKYVEKKMYRSFIIALIVWTSPIIIWSQSLTDSAAKSFALQDSNGTIHRLEDYRGRIILLDFWASWCAPCIKAIPEIKDLYNKYDDRMRFEIISVSMDFDKSHWVTALKRHQPAGINLCTFTENYASVRKNYNVVFLPKTYLIDENGIFIGEFSTPNEVDRKLSVLLSAQH